ncbi:FadR/GntR family transcriptional regulator [Rugosimonospora africana]|uniref:GntR family transcriptional regulator n=1 Tax=Rugosimonospora africana TaxID=556532 RepID=A0A8J3QU28_9ACTN|nr:FadR/GntR family transcriptional regulator [Rugosimonospora africana]GIH15800.1 GntR family transcriptional regulator [Rugosimonospora africana]
MTDRIRRHPLAEQAAEAILARVGAGEWALGHKLPGETTLAVTLGVGRSTVREAIRELAGRGVLESRQGAGVFVQSTQPVEVWPTVMRRAGIAEVIEGRIAIESEAARLAADRRTPADLRAMRSLLRERERAARQAGNEGYVDADTAFHRAVVAAAHNSVLTELFQAFVPRVRGAMLDMLRLAPAHRGRADHEAHAAIVEAIRDRLPEDAATLSRAHLAAMRDRVVGRPAPEARASGRA